MYIVLIRLYGYFPLDLFLWCNIVAQAGLAYLQHCNLLVHCHCDKVHRLIRDLKLSNGCDPKFNEAVLATTYAWSVNYKPHGSGAFGDEKYDLLANFFDTCVMEDSLKANLIILVLCFFLHHSKIIQRKTRSWWCCAKTFGAGLGALPAVQVSHGSGLWRWFWQDTNRWRNVESHVRVAILSSQKGLTKTRQVVRLAWVCTPTAQRVFCHTLPSALVLWRWGAASPWRSKYKISKVQRGSGGLETATSSFDICQPWDCMHHALGQPTLLDLVYGTNLWDQNPPGRSWATHDVGFVLVQRCSLAGHCENSVWLAVSEEVGVLPSAPRQNWWWWPSSNCVQICVKCPVKKIMDNVKVWHSSWVLCGTCLVMCRSSPGSHACDEERLAGSQSGGTVGQMC